MTLLSNLDYFYGAFLSFVDLNIKSSITIFIFLFHGTIFEWSIPLTLILFVSVCVCVWILMTGG